MCVPHKSESTEGVHTCSVSAKPPCCHLAREGWKQLGVDGMRPLPMQGPTSLTPFEISTTGGVAGCCIAGCGCCSCCFCFGWAESCSASPSATHVRWTLSNHEDSDDTNELLSASLRQKVRTKILSILVRDNHHRLIFFAHSHIDKLARKAISALLQQCRAYDPTPWIYPIRNIASSSSEMLATPSNLI